MKSIQQSSMLIEKMDKSTLLHSCKYQNIKQSFFSTNSQFIIPLLLNIIVILTFVIAHFYFKEQIASLKKETNDTMVLLEKQKREISDLTEVRKNLDEEIDTIECQKKNYELLLSESITSIEKIQQEHDKIKEILNIMNKTIEIYEDENNNLKIQIERKKKSILSVIH